MCLKYFELSPCLQKLSFNHPLIFTIFLSHLLLTGPSIIYHSLLTLYYRIISKPSILLCQSDKDVIVLVHGRGGHYSNFHTLSHNLQKHLPHVVFSVDLGDYRNTTIDTDASTLFYSLLRT